MGDRRERWWMIIAGDHDTIGRSGTLLGAYHDRDSAMAEIATADDGSVVVAGEPRQWAMVLDMREIVGEPPRWYLVEAGRDVGGIEESIWDGPHATIDRAIQVIGDPGGPIIIQDRRWDWAGITLLDRIILADWYAAEHAAIQEDRESEGIELELDDEDDDP